MFVSGHAERASFANPAHLPLILRPGRPLLFKTFGPEAESGVFPIEYLEHGSAAVTEHEAGTIEMVLPETSDAGSDSAYFLIRGRKVWYLKFLISSGVNKNPVNPCEPTCGTGHEIHD